jgi:hypothetical protein
MILIQDISAERIEAVFDKSAVAPDRMMALIRALLFGTFAIACEEITGD